MKKIADINIQLSSYNMTEAIATALEGVEDELLAHDPASDLFTVGGWSLVFNRLEVRKGSWRDDSLSYFFCFHLEAR